MKLNEKIRKGEIKLTEYEKMALQAIRDEGSFFEESGGNETIARSGNCFFGWEISERDVDNKFNPAGVISSLVKKGVLSTYEDEGLTGYILNYELDFAEDDKYKLIFEEV